MERTMKRKKSISLAGQKSLYGYIFIIPFLIGFIAFFLPSVIDSLIYAFNDVKIDYSKINKTFIGFKNFKDSLLVDVNFRVYLTSAIKGMLLDALIVIIFSFFIANILNQKFIGRTIARVVFFLPVILSTGLVASVEFGAGRDLYNAMALAGENTGMVGRLGGPILFNLKELLLSSGINSNISGAIVYAVSNTYNVVNASGVQILVFISALQAINPSIFEATKVEGATKWEEFWKITFPILTPMIFVNIVYSIVDTFTNPIYGVMSYIRDQAFISGRIGYASALSWIYFVIVMLTLGIITKIISKRISYLD